MKIPLLLIQAFACMVFANAQQSTTFTIEKLDTKDSMLPAFDYKEVLQNMIRLANSDGKTLNNVPHFPYNVVANDRANDKLIEFGNHPFFNGMYEAYANHHPFILSPDMVWLLIAQGFAHHVTNNAEELRSMFVDFKGKETLVVQNNAIRLDNPNSPWEDVFPEFTSKIGDETGAGLINTLTPNFTTTTPVNKIAADITIMDAMKEYFDYYVMTFMCGIPKITLEGTPDDWLKVLDKANALRKYKLDWWINEIEPPLKQFVRAANGHVDTAFWRNMFKYHTLEKYGKPKVIDGWIIKFFPYDNDGKRNSLAELSSANNLPNEMVTVDLKHILVDNKGKPIKITPLELWAGFVGVKEDTQTFGLRPAIGWMIRIKDTGRVALKKAISTFKEEEGSTIEIRVKSVPPEILALKAVDELDIHFIGDVIIPDGLAHCVIKTLRLYGNITPSEAERVHKLFPNTELWINDAKHQ